jgi:hypothetical protein
VVKEYPFNVATLYQMQPSLMGTQGKHLPVSDWIKVSVTVAERVCVIAGGTEVAVTVNGSGANVIVVGLLIVVGISSPGRVKVDCAVTVICYASTVRVDISVPTEVIILVEATQGLAT